MILKSHYLLVFIVVVLTASGCAATKVAEEPRPDSTMGPIQLASTDLGVKSIGIIGVGNDGTLVEDQGWREFILEIENRSTMPLTIRSVKLLNVNGRYFESATSYEQITAPPNVAVELAGDVAKNAAGIVAGQFIPFGGLITSVFSNAASASSARAKADAKRVFARRVLNKVELAPEGKVTGSAFLPNIPNAKALVISYAKGEKAERLEVLLPIIDHKRDSRYLRQVGSPYVGWGVRAGRTPVF